MKKPKMTSDNIIGLLKAKHPHDKGEWATFAELRCGTGFSNEQRIDFFAMNTWPSKKFRSVAYEVKLSRADFFNELKNPKKREFAESVSHECYFAVPDGLISIDEVPEGWGLCFAQEGRLSCVKFAQQRDLAAFPQFFVASLARRSADPKPTASLKAWRMSGKELTEDDLLELVRESYSKGLYEERREAANEALAKYKSSGDIEKMLELRRLVLNKLNLSPWQNYIEAAQLVFDSGDANTPARNRKIEQAIRLLNEAIKGG